MTRIVPAEARPGDAVTIEGTGFGASASAVTVTFRGVPASLGSVSPSAIQTTVPDLTPGDAPVVVTVGGEASVPRAFDVLSLPTVTAVVPGEGRPGETVVIEGTGFGSQAEAVSVTFGGAQATVAAVSNTAIEATVPEIGAGEAPVVVTVAGRTTEAAAFTVLAPLLRLNLWVSNQSLGTGVEEVHLRVLVDGEALLDESLAVERQHNVVEITAMVESGAREVEVQAPGHGLARTETVVVEGEVWMLIGFFFNPVSPTPAQHTPSIQMTTYQREPGIK